MVPAAWTSNERAHLRTVVLVAYCVQDWYSLIAAASHLRRGTKTVRGVMWARRGYQTSERQP